MGALFEELAGFCVQSSLEPVIPANCALNLHHRQSAANMPQSDPCTVTKTSYLIKWPHGAASQPAPTGNCFYLNRVYEHRREKKNLGEKIMNQNKVAVRNPKLFFFFSACNLCTVWSFFHSCVANHVQLRFWNCCMRFTVQPPKKRPDDRTVYGRGKEELSQLSGCKRGTENYFLPPFINWYKSTE